MTKPTSPQRLVANTQLEDSREHEPDAVDLEVWDRWVVELEYGKIIAICSTRTAAYSKADELYDAGFTRVVIEHEGQHEDMVS